MPDGTELQITPQTAAPEPHPNVRTMKSDVSEYLRATKPSLIKMLTSQIENDKTERVRPRETARNYTGLVGAILIVLISIGVLGVGGYFIYKMFNKVPVQQANIVIPQPLFAVDGSETVSARLPNGGDLISVLNKHIPSNVSMGSLRRLVILTELGDGSVRSLRPDEFLKGAGVRASQIFLAALTGPVMPVYAATSQGARLALVMPTNDPDRARSELLNSESSILFNWQSLFLDRKPELKVVPFEDRIYRNISYRFAAAGINGDQFLYGAFPAKNYIVITSSEETFRLIIDRLYEAS